MHALRWRPTAACRNALCMHSGRKFVASRAIFLGFLKSCLFAASKHFEPETHPMYMMPLRSSSSAPLVPAGPPRFAAASGCFRFASAAVCAFSFAAPAALLADMAAGNVQMSK